MDIDHNSMDLDKRQPDADQSVDSMANYNSDTDAEQSEQSSVGA